MTDHVMLFYFLLFAVPGFFLFDSEKGCSGRAVNAFIFGLIMGTLTLYFWYVTCIIILLVGFAISDGKKYVMYIAAVLALVTAITGISFRKDADKRHNNEPDKREVQRQAQEIEEQRKRAEQEQKKPEPKPASESASQSSPKPVVETASSAPAAAAYADKQVGDRFEFGSYPQGDNGEVKPITWRVLKRESDSLLVISELCLDAEPYNYGKMAVSWSKCTLRRWLNDEFLHKAFSSSEQALIRTSKLDNNAGPATEDLVFLLSEDEAKSLIVNTDGSKAMPTAYAIESGADTYDSYAWWWLRSRGSSDDSAARVGSYGNINSYYVNSASGSVRPAFRIAI
ncbi:hypothetical protein IJT93_08920 [bacterium]|nr:hypothetical protein [bacterium]